MAAKYYLDVAGLEALIRKIVSSDKAIGSRVNEITGQSGDSYTANTGMTYINDASSLQNAVEQLDTAIQGLGTSSHAAATAGNGIQGNGTNGALDATHQQISVKAKKNGGITVDANGVSVNTNASNGLTLKKLTTATSGFASSYQMQLNGTAFGDTINIPQDQFLKSVSLASEAPTTAEGNSADITAWPALRFEWEIVTDSDGETPDKSKSITYVSLGALAGTGDVTKQATVDDSTADYGWVTTTEGLVKASELASALNSMDNTATSTAAAHGIQVSVRQANGIVDKVTVTNKLATVAGTGSYNDLSDKPTATDISYTDTTSLVNGTSTAVTNVQAAIAALDSRLDTVEGVATGAASAGSTVKTGNEITAGAVDSNRQQTLSVNVDNTTIQSSFKSGSSGPKQLSAKTAAVAANGTSLATGGQIATYVTNQISGLDGEALASTAPTAVSYSGTNSDEFQVLTRVNEVGGKVKAVDATANSTGSKSVTLKKVAATGAYTDLTSKPVLNTNNTTAQTANASETITGTINLHKVSKTGAAADVSVADAGDYLREANNVEDAIQELAGNYISTAYVEAYFNACVASANTNPTTDGTGAAHHVDWTTTGPHGATSSNTQQVREDIAMTPIQQGGQVGG